MAVREDVDVSWLAWKLRWKVEIDGTHLPGRVSAMISPGQDSAQ